MTNELYNPYDGFIRGNLFEDLYSPYKVKPYDIKPSNDQANLLTYIDSLSFACHDLNLYLDIFSGDKNIIDLYNQYSEEAKKLLDTYEKSYGPLMVSNLESYPWSWNKSPWPWE